MKPILMIASASNQEIMKIREAVSAFDVDITEVTTGPEVITNLGIKGLFLVILDLDLPDCDGMKVLAEARKRHDTVSLILLVPATARETIPMDALNRGASDFLVKSWETAELRSLVHKQLEKHRILTGGRLIGKSSAFIELVESIILVAPTPMTVLITGESGTGKELVARSLHDASSRYAGPFYPINCGAIPETLLESELFGHEKGAFTGAHESKQGKFEVAGGGTLFLDEIGEMPLSLQVKLLRVLEDYRIIRVGGTKEIPVDTRIVAATNRNLEEEVRAGRFRKDLYYRLKIVLLNVPPLRERKEDIPLLVDFFKETFIRKNDTPHPGFSPAAMNFLTRYSWPGNIRELKSIIESTMIFHPGKLIEPDALPESIYSPGPSNPMLPSLIERPKDEIEREIIYKTLLALRDEIAEVRKILSEAFPASGRGREGVAGAGMDAPFDIDGVQSGPLGDFRREPVMEADFEFEDEQDGGETREHSLEDMEREVIRRALLANNGNRKNTALALGIGERTLYRKIKKYNL